jgi:hypothetical protein
MYLDAAGVGGSLTYFYQKPSYSISNSYYYADLKNIDTLPRWSPSIIFLTIVGIIWLGVGGFVLFKQGSRSPFVIHFATICLAAFVFHAYRSLNLGQDFDLAVSLLDDIAFAFFAPLFLHFACVPGTKRGVRFVSLEDIRTICPGVDHQFCFALLFVGPVGADRFIRIRAS